MTQSEIRDRLLELARVRLKARFGAFEQFRFTLDSLVEGSAILARASLMPAPWTTAFRLGLGEAATLIDAHFLRIIDDWAQREAPARQIPALEGVQPLAAEPRAQTPRPALVLADNASNAPLDAPPPVATSDVAHAFDGIRGWDEKAWKDNLGSPQKWLDACIAIRGQRGVRETRWNPVLIGAALVDKGHAKPNRIRARFQTKPQLQDWLEAWKTYEADNFDT